MSPAEAAELWEAVANMTGGNPTSALPVKQWVALREHMLTWSKKRSRYDTAEGERFYNDAYTIELRRTWAKLFLGRTL